MLPTSLVSDSVKTQRKKIKNWTPKVLWPLHTHVQVYICMPYSHAYIYTCTYIPQRHTQTPYIHVHIITHICTHAKAYTRAHTYVYMQRHTLMHTHIYTCTHIKEKNPAVSGQAICTLGHCWMWNLEIVVISLCHPFQYDLSAPKATAITTLHHDGHITIF